MSEIIIHNVETGEIIQREMNKNELETFAKIKANAEKLENEQLLVEEKRQALLEKLGITAEEARLLLGGTL